MHDDKSSSGQMRWATRGLLSLAVGGPAIWLGGVRPATVVVFAGVCALLLARLALGKARVLRLPDGLWVFGIAAGLCVIQWLPLSILPRVLAPEIHAVAGEALAGTDIGWNRISTIPGSTLLEVSRVLALAGLFFAAAQVSWRISAVAAGAVGSAVSAIGLVQLGFGSSKILGLYKPVEAPQAIDGMLTTFVNPNHQASLFLLGLLAAAALAYEELRRGAASGDALDAKRHADRAMVFLGMSGFQLVGLLLSYSRGALLAFCICLPAILWLVFRSNEVRRRGEATRRWLIGLLLGLAVAVALVGRLGTWESLMTLTRIDTVEAKVRTTREALDLIWLSPVVGVGRGTFVALFPLVDSAPQWKTFTHVESFPVAVLVEWGPLPGLIMLGGGALWFVRTFRGHRETSRRLALCGVAAVAVHGCFDFSLEYLGVTAPLIAVCGSLSSHRRLKIPAQKAAGAAAVVVALAAVVAGVAWPSTWPALRHAKHGLSAERVESDRLLERSPLDPQYHLTLGRAAATAGEWEQALARARTATRFLPASVDAWLLRSVAEENALDVESEAAENSLRRALSNLRERPAEDLVLFLAGSKTPEELHRAAPQQERQWALLVEALVLHAPHHAHGVAFGRLEDHPRDPIALRYASRVSTRLERHWLATQTAETLVQVEPKRARSHLLLAAATRAADGEIEARAVLRAALEVDDLEHQPRVEEALASSLSTTQGDETLREALELAQAALRGATNAEERKRRRALIARLEGMLAER